MFDQMLWAHFFSELNLKIQKIYQLCLEKQSKQTDSEWPFVFETFQNIVQKAMLTPDQLAKQSMDYSKESIELWQQISTGKSVPTEYFDKRFKEETWQTQPLYRWLQQHYLIICKRVESGLSQVKGIEGNAKKKLHFYAKQFLDAISPAHFPFTNPEVLKKVLDSQGTSILKGLDHLIEDLESQEGLLQIPMADERAFEVGENVAITPGNVVYQNDLMQLIQYEPQTKQVYQKPLLIIPPWINKYYILDLSEHNSWVNWLVKKGYTVFIISWVNPNKEHANKCFENYLLEGSLAALDVIEEITGQKSTNVVGYCIGGTLLACTLSYLEYHNQADRITSGTYLTTLLDFSKPGDLGVFIDEKQISQLEKKMAKKGFLDGKTMAHLFNLLRANDLIWSSYIKRYLAGEAPKPLDLLFWNADGAHLPEAMQSFYLRNMYLHNNLAKPNGIVLGNTPIDLKRIKTPVYFFSAEQDHIAPWESTYKGRELHSGPTVFVLGGAGHIAGVVNPPHKNKYYYYTQSRPYKKASTFIKNAKKQEGSWWVHWEKWLREKSGKMHDFQPLKQKRIEKAPGAYVKIRL